MKANKWMLTLAAVLLMAAVAVTGVCETLTGEADGFGGAIQAVVTVEDGKITALELTGKDETPAIGGAALEPLKEAILAAGTVDGVEAVSGATWTSNGVFEAVRSAMGEETAEAETEVAAVTASALSHGIGVVSTPRLGPGKDAQEVGVYSFNEVVAYVVVDSEQRIADLEVDVLEIITPNHDEPNDGDNFLAGWPGQAYNSDAEGDGVIEGQLEETEEIFTEETGSWLTKREKGSAYKMNSGTWEGEMDIYERFFVGKTVEEIRAWNEKYCSSLNGRPVSAASKKDEDIAKYNALTDEEKALCDAISGATMSLTDPHGDILAAIAKAVENATPIENVTAIAKTGLGIDVMPRLGPGKDDQEVPCYSINVAVAGACYDAEGKVVALKADVLEIITPNHDGAHDNAFTGWPGQAYNADGDADGKVEAVWEQTEESFTEQVAAFRTKRDLGSAYKMNSGTWADEMNAYEAAMTGKTTEEITAWFEACFSDLNGRALRGTSTKDADVAKYGALTDAQRAEMDALSCATMSLRDGHGDILGAIEKACANAKAVEITVE